VWIQEKKVLGKKLRILYPDIKELIKQSRYNPTIQIPFFLNQIGEGEEYNNYRKTFDDASSGGYVELDEMNDIFTLNSNHKRNQKNKLFIVGPQ